MKLEFKLALVPMLILFTCNSQAAMVPVTCVDSDSSEIFVVSTQDTKALWRDVLTVTGEGRTVHLLASFSAGETMSTSAEGYLAYSRFAARGAVLTRSTQLGSGGNAGAVSYTLDLNVPQFHARHLNCQDPKNRFL